MTFDYNRPLCMYYKLDTRMSQKACEHFEEKEYVRERADGIAC